MKKKFCFVTILFCVLTVVNMQIIYAEIVYDDGQLHNLNSPTTEPISVRNNFFNQPTTLNINGSSHYILSVSDASRVNMYGGSFDTYGMAAHDNSSIFFYDGFINGNLEGGYNSFVEVSGGVIGTLWGNGYADVSMLDGQIETVWADTYSSVSLHSGNINLLKGTGSSNTFVYGGIIRNLYLQESSNLTLYGSGFQIDGIDVEYTTYYTNNRAIDAVLTGTLVNGDPINAPLEMWNYSTITFEPVPEPCTILLLGLGGLLIKKR